MRQQTRSARRRDPSKVSYDWYINSAAWERRKVAYYAKHPRRCRACGTTQDIHLHHHTYKRLGREHDDDLIPLCQPHHDAVHRLHRSVDFTGTITEATRHVIGGPLHPPRNRKKPAVVRTRATGTRPHSPADVVRFDLVTAAFDVSRTSLRKQGYHRGVPRARLVEWSASLPSWIAGVKSEKLVQQLTNRVR